jgi:hypothetical protein
LEDYKNGEFLIWSKNGVLVAERALKVDEMVPFIVRSVVV